MSCGHLYLDVPSLNTVKHVLWPPPFGCSLTQYSKTCLIATSIWMFDHSIQLNMPCGHLNLDVCSLNTVKPVLWPLLFGCSLTQYSKTCLVATSIWMFPHLIQSNLSCGHLHLDVRSLSTVNHVLWPPPFGYSITQYCKTCLVATSIWMFTHSIQLNLSCGHLYLDVPSLSTVKRVLWPPLFRCSLTQYSKTCLVATSIWMYAHSIQLNLSCGHFYLDVPSLSTEKPVLWPLLFGCLLNTVKHVLWPLLFGCSLTQYSKTCQVATSICMFAHSIQQNLSCGHLYLDVPSLNSVKHVLWPPHFGRSLTQYSKTCLVATSIGMFAHSISKTCLVATSIWMFTHSIQ